MFCPVLEFRKEKLAFAKIEGGNVNFFLTFSMLQSATLQDAARASPVPSDAAPPFPRSTHKITFPKKNP
jgi:hypothetical protein